MKVTIKETAENAELRYEGKNSGIDCFADWANVSGCEDFAYVEDSETGEPGYIVDQCAYDWWTDRIAEEEALDDRIAELRESLDEEGIARLDRCIFDAADSEFNDSAKITLRAINDEFAS